MTYKSNDTSGIGIAIALLLPSRINFLGWCCTLIQWVCWLNPIRQIFGRIAEKSRNDFKFIVVFIIVLSSCLPLAAQQATWIWYPGDFEIALSNQMQNRRTDRGAMSPIFWKTDNAYPLIDFHKVIELVEPEEATVTAEGRYNVKIDGILIEGSPEKITVPAGKHSIDVKVFNQAEVPAIFVQGKKLVSDASWLATYEDKAVNEAAMPNAGSWHFNAADQLPSAFKLPVVKMNAVSVTKTNRSLLADFGKETFGFLQLHGISGAGKINIYYGESKDEALSADHCEILDRLVINAIVKTDTTLVFSKAFRFVNIQYDEALSIDSVSMLHEYADLPDKGSFRCSDTLINKIYEIAAYTLHLSTREFFIDGIKRDRWVWSGDAYQSYLMNYYLMNDNETVKRTMYALRGKDPVTGHINTIMDYTFYWFMGIYDYFLYTGDKSFILQNYPRMQSLMAYCLGRRNKNGLMEGMPGDWVFIDWADGLSKAGELSFEQLLLCRSLETMAICAGIVNDNKSGDEYKTLSADLRKKLFDYYWNNSKQALVHSRINENQSANVTRYANMFSIFFDYFNEQQKQAVKKSVLLNDSIQKITTPYMRFYELESLCALGEQAYVLQQMKDYWGGMLQLGATSFWELYDPAEKGGAQYAMYGRPFGKSLCHAWGASPIYLLGKYYLGVRPTAPGYATYTVEPVLGGLQWMEGKIPTPAGNITMYCSNTQIKITSAGGTGLLKIKSKTKPGGKNLSMIAKAGNAYEITIQPGTDYVINYKAL